ncbi:hypothetical protein SNEBB_007930 [Seison nebaliae]|nr:hypothetical protein SNEBB_007930 [Seison nebaliae]
MNDQNEIERICEKSGISKSKNFVEKTLNILDVVHARLKQYSRMNLRNTEQGNICAAIRISLQVENLVVSKQSKSVITRCSGMPANDFNKLFNLLRKSFISNEIPNKTTRIEETKMEDSKQRILIYNNMSIDELAIMFNMIDLRSDAIKLVKTYYEKWGNIGEMNKNLLNASALFVINSLQAPTNKSGLCSWSKEKIIKYLEIPSDLFTHQCEHLKKIAEISNLVKNEESKENRLEVNDMKSEDVDITENITLERYRKYTDPRKDFDEWLSSMQKHIFVSEEYDISPENKKRSKLINPPSSTEKRRCRL